MLDACSATTSAPHKQAAADGGTGTNSFGNAVTSTTCTAGTQLPCYCPDGTETGSQVCTSAGELGACVGCKTAAGATLAPVDPVKDGQLCPMLSGQSGCTDQSYRSTKLPASVLFLVDRSGSMICNPPELGQTSAECDAKAETKSPGQPTKWSLVTAALEKVLGNLTGTGVAAGVSFFSNDDVCGVSSKPAVEVAAVDAPHAQQLMAALHSAAPGGGTPIVGGTILSYKHLYEEAGLDATGGCAQPPCGARGNRFVVLITDGSDSCPMEPTPGACGGEACTDFLLDHSAPAAAGVNIRTFVIGAPGSEGARGFLSELAWQGGTAKSQQCKHDRKTSDGNCHFDMTTTTDFAADLSAALTAISGSALSCEFAVPQPAGRPPTDNVNVQYSAGGTAAPVCLGFDEKPCDGGANGWQFAKNPDGTKNLAKVVLCGSACETVKKDPAIRVDVVLGCQSITVQ